MKLEATLLVHGPVLNAEPHQGYETLTDRVWFVGDLPGADLVIGGRRVGEVVSVVASGDYALTDDERDLEFAASETRVDCILEF